MTTDFLKVRIIFLHETADHRLLHIVSGWMMLEAANSSLLEGADLNQYSYPDSNVSRVGNAFLRPVKW